MFSSIFKNFIVESNSLEKFSLASNISSTSGNYLKNDFRARRHINKIENDVLKGEASKNIIFRAILVRYIALRTAARLNNFCWQLPEIDLQ